MLQILIGYKFYINVYTVIHVLLIWHLFQCKLNYYSDTFPFSRESKREHFTYLFFYTTYRCTPIEMRWPLTLSAIHQSLRGTCPVVYHYHQLHPRVFKDGRQSIANEGRSERARKKPCVDVAPSTAGRRCMFPINLNKLRMDGTCIIYVSHAFICM